MGGKARLWLCTSTPSSLLLHIKAEGRREGGESGEGWGYCEWKTKCFSNSHARRAEMNSAGSPRPLVSTPRKLWFSKRLYHTLFCAAFSYVSQKGDNSRDVALSRSEIVSFHICLLLLRYRDVTNMSWIENSSTWTQPVRWIWVLQDPKKTINNKYIKQNPQWWIGLFVHMKN